MVRIDGWSERLTESKDGLLRVITAHWCDKKKGKKIRLKAGKIDVVKERINGKFAIRGILEYQGMFGYALSSTLGWGDDYGKIWEKRDKRWYEKNWSGDYDKKKKGFSWKGARDSKAEPLTSKHESMILKHYPGFKWTLESMKETVREEGLGFLSLCVVWRMLQQWVRMPEAELLWKAGYQRLALSRALTRKTEKEKKNLIAWLRKGEVKDKDRWYLTYSAIKAMSKGISLEDYTVMTTTKMSKEVFAYYKEQKKRSKNGKGMFVTEPSDFVRLYRDYMRMLEASDHDQNDEYWKKPKDLETFHRRLVDEEAKKREAAQKEKIEKLNKILKKWKGKEVKNGSLRVYVPETRDEILTQAKALHQCIVAAGYDMRMADEDLTLVFISRNGKPAATAEIFNNTKLGQFYGDEGGGWQNAEPKEDERKALEEWRKLYFSKPIKTKNKRRAA